MKILIVSQYFWPENFRINDLCKELTSRGHNVTVLTGVPNYPAGVVFDSYRNNPAAYDRYEGARIFRSPMLPRGKGGIRLVLNYMSFAIGASLVGLLKLRNRDFDVIFVFEPSPITVGLPAVLISKLAKAPIVFWVLDLWPETLSAIGVVKSPGVLNLVGKLVGFIYNNCTFVLGQSRAFLTNIHKYCVDSSKAIYFPSWAEDVFDSQVSPAIEVEHLPDVFNIVFAGNIGEAQDMPAVLNAAECLKGNDRIRWLIVGDGRKSDWLAEEVKKRGLQNTFLLLGRFPVERMPSFFAHADALLVSLKRDPVFSMTIPGKVQSYLMAGLPILGMLDGEGASVISDANAGLTCAAGDGAGLAKAVLEMASMSRQERQALGHNGRAYAEREFGRQNLMSKLEGLLQEAAILGCRG